MLLLPGLRPCKKENPKRSIFNQKSRCLASNAQSQSGLATKHVASPKTFYFFRRAPAPANNFYRQRQSLNLSAEKLFSVEERLERKKKTFLVTILHSAKGHRSISSVVGLTHSAFLLRFDYSFNLVFHEPPRKVVYCQSHPAITRVCHCAAKTFLRSQSNAVISTSGDLFSRSPIRVNFSSRIAQNRQNTLMSPLFTSFSLLWSKVKWHMQSDQPEHKLLHKLALDGRARRSEIAGFRAHASIL